MFLISKFENPDCWYECDDGEGRHAENGCDGCCRCRESCIGIGYEYECVEEGLCLLLIRDVEDEFDDDVVEQDMMESRLALLCSGMSNAEEG